jgi:hypothetical protein
MLIKNEKYSIMRIVIDFNCQDFDRKQLENIIFLLFISLYYPVQSEVLVSGSKNKVRPFFIKKIDQTFDFKILTGVLRCLL